LGNLAGANRDSRRGFLPTSLTTPVSQASAPNPIQSQHRKLPQRQTPGRRNNQTLPPRRATHAWGALLPLLGIPHLIDYPARARGGIPNLSLPIHPRPLPPAPLQGCASTVLDCAAACRCCLLRLRFPSGLCPVPHGPTSVARHPTYLGSILCCTLYPLLSCAPILIYSPFSTSPPSSAFPYLTPPLLSFTFSRLRPRPRSRLRLRLRHRVALSFEGRIVVVAAVA
jgi:hypothetical protein